MIAFNIPPCVGTELNYIAKTIENKKICGDGQYTHQCSEFLEQQTGALKVLLTTSGSHALEMSARLCGLQQGDEVIMPSYTFTSTANAFVQVGARVKFVDIDPKTMNIDPLCVANAITPRTRVLVVVHYAGVSCEMDQIMDLVEANSLLLVEDAAQAVNAYYKGKALGTFGTFGCYSFHETKNYSMGEGGALLINDPAYIERAEILREKGTNRSRYLRGQVDKYSWVDYGSSYLPSELNAAFLYAQLLCFDEINQNRLKTWKTYYDGFYDLEKAGHVELPHIPADCSHNAHMFYIKLKNLEERTELMSYLKRNGVISAFHYVPLHSAPAGMRFGDFVGTETFTTVESDRLLRLPLYYKMKEKDIERVMQTVRDFFEV